MLSIFLFSFSFSAFVAFIIFLLVSSIMRKYLFLFIFLSTLSFSQTCEWEDRGISAESLCAAAAQFQPTRCTPIQGEEHQRLVSIEICQGNPCPPPTVWDQLTQNCVSNQNQCINTIMSTGCNGIYSSSGGGSACIIARNPAGCLNSPQNPQNPPGSNNNGGAGSGGSPGGSPPNAPPPPLVCQTQSGATCYQPPNSSGGCPAGHAFGSFNGSGICVSTIPVSQTPSLPASAGQQVNPQSMPNNINNPPSTTTNTTTSPGANLPDGSPTTTTTTTSTTDNTTTTSDFNTSGLYTCSDGRLADSISSCDSNLTCSSHMFLVQGVCVQLPVVTSNNTTTTTTTTTTNTNNNTGQPVSSTTSTSTGNSTVPIPNQPSSSGSGSSTVNVDVDLSGVESLLTQINDNLMGDCDPNAIDYAECIQMTESVADNYLDNLNNNSNTSASDLISTYQESFTDFIDDNTSSSISANPSIFESTLNNLIPSHTACSAQTMVFSTISLSISCSKINDFKVMFGWFLYVATIIYLFTLALTPIESKS